MACEEPVKEQETGNFLVKVFEYVYAPGQHAQIALMSDTAKITGDPEDNSFIYLGGYGGYLTASFRTDVKNDLGDDFAVWALKSASAEPAIVWVMEDANGDNLPNETWYELKGSEYENSTREYSVSYEKTDSCVNWSDNLGGSGVLIPGYGALNSSIWWWPATTTSKITLSGSLLPNVMMDTDTTESQHWEPVEIGFNWGYAENLLGEDYNKDQGYNSFDISNAVDSDGKAVQLSQIRFIKIQSAVFQIAGWLNEISPEIKGASEL